ncbi:MAG: hypothetical protein ACYTEZ_04440 [Planctomycetota bacterium]|jgi:hypothetical protein
MRWTVLLLLAACSRWTAYEGGDDARPELAAALRAEHARAFLVTGARAFVLPEGALGEEVRAFTSVLADAAESQRYSIYPGRGIHVTPDPDPGAVVSYAYPDRLLQLPGPVHVQAARRGAGYVYWVSVLRGARRYAYVAVRATPEIERAWGRLVSRATAEARPAKYPPAPLLTMAGEESFVRYVDLRDVGPGSG